MQPLPNGKQQFFYPNGSPLVGGKVFHYMPNTTTPQNTYQDSTGTTPNTNPIILDGNGQAVIFGSGSYRQVVQDSVGNTIWDQTTSVSETTQQTSFVWLTSVSGTDTITASSAAQFTSYQAGQTFQFSAAGSNTTTTPTLNINALGAKNIVKSGGVALSIGDIQTGAIIQLVYDGTQFIFMNTAPYTTGDLKLTLKTAADSGWVMFNDGTIGSATSGATTRANADTQALYALLWNNVADAWCPVVGGRGASASADFSANKPITLQKALGRALALSGSGSGLTARALGSNLGEETHLLTAAEMPSHNHTATDSGHAHTYDAGNTNAGGTNKPGMSGSSSFTAFSTSVGNANISVGYAGGGGAHNVMQPTTFLNAMVKL